MTAAPIRLRRLAAAVKHRLRRELGEQHLVDLHAKRPTAEARHQHVTHTSGDGMDGRAARNTLNRRTHAFPAWREPARGVRAALQTLRYAVKASPARTQNADNEGERHARQCCKERELLHARRGVRVGAFSGRARSGVHTVGAPTCRITSSVPMGMRRS
eukprot:5016081-Pleurochrysis_carterae.AAC.1